MIQQFWNEATRVLTGLTLVGLSLLLGGCGAAMKQLGEELSDEYVDFKPVYKAEFSARSGNAVAVDKGTDILGADEFIDLGRLSIKYVDKRCFPGEECETESHSEQPTQRLLKEAARVGGDAVVITQDNQSRSGQAVKNGACINTTTQQVPYSVCDYEMTCNGGSCTTRQTICHTEYRSQTVCTEWQKIYGEEFFRRSAATVWRNDPQLLVDVKFGDLFYDALKVGDLAMAMQYLDRGIRADLPDLRGRYPLMTAVEAKQNASRVTRLVLERGANPTIDNNRPLEIATRNNNIEMTAALLEYGANPNDSVGIWGHIFSGGDKKILEKGGPIINASKNNNVELVRLLLENKADPNVDNGQPLRNAIRLENNRMLFLLLDHGARPREEGVLTAAVEKGDIELVRLMFDHGALPNNRSWSGKTPLQAAAEAGYADIIRLLLDEGASINKRGVGGTMTPLMYAASNGQVEAVRILIEAKAALDVDDIATGLGWVASLASIKGKTALTMAKSGYANSANPERKADYKKIVDMLIAAGAKQDP